jgi:hypothetical protein
MNSGGSNQDGEMPSLTLSEWNVILARTARELLSGLDRWRDDDHRIAAIFANLKRRPAACKS